MLPAHRRLRRSDEFGRTVRGGRRAGSRVLVVHLLTDAAPARRGGSSQPEPDRVPEPARVGLVVGRGVGGSVVRSRVSRRLRHVLRARLDRLPADSLLVVRAGAPAAAADSVTLAAELDRALDRLLPRTTAAS